MDPSSKQTPDNLTQTAEKAFAAWQYGELTGNYTNFKTLLADDFNVFSHPSPDRGVYYGERARTALLKLIEGRAMAPNQLIFSNAQFLVGSKSVAVQFDSEGSFVNRKYSYKGYNVIVFEIEKEKISGFREYFGDVDPSWFEKL